MKLDTLLAIALWVFWITVIVAPPMLALHAIMAPIFADMLLIQYLFAYAVVGAVSAYLVVPLIALWLIGLGLVIVAVL